MFQDEPFTSHLPEALFNISRYLLHMMQGGIPYGISKVYPLFYFFSHIIVKHVTLRSGRTCWPGVMICVLMSRATFLPVDCRFNELALHV